VMGASVSCIADRIFDAGHHEVAWDGRNSEGRAVSSGVYFLRMEANDYSAVRRAVLLR
jgi:flagellar hook assembly protein FlgD